MIDVHFRRESHSFSLSELPTVVGFFLMAPNDYLLALLVGSGVALVFVSRQPWLKVGFNLANSAFIAVVMLTVFRGDRCVHRAAGSDRLARRVRCDLRRGRHRLVHDRHGHRAVGRRAQYEKLPEMIEFGGLVALANTSLALLAVTILWIDPIALGLLAVPLITMFVAYRAYVSEREKHERLELLYQSSRILQHSPELDRALVALLDHARDMFRAELAEVLLRSTDGVGHGLRSTSIQDDEPELMVPVDLPEDDALRVRAEVERRAFFAIPAHTPRGSSAVDPPGDDQPRSSAKARRSGRSPS